MCQEKEEFETFHSILAEIIFLFVYGKKFKNLKKIVDFPLKSNALHRLLVENTIFLFFQIFSSWEPNIMHQILNLGFQTQDKDKQEAWHRTMMHCNELYSIHLLSDAVQWILVVIVGFGTKIQCIASHLKIYKISPSYLCS